MSTDLPGRMLRLLALLESRREWSGPELARRLGVTDRTIRRDVERLRELGYPVAGTTGAAGGYRLESGRDLPPLLFEDDEVVALAVGLRTATSASVAGIDDAAVRALAKLERVLPPRLRERVATLGEVTAGVATTGAPPVAAELLATLAAACRDHELVVFDYRRRDGTIGSRRVEPYRLVATHGRWHLLAYDVHRGGWRTFRLDRLAAPTPVRHRFTPRPLPDPDPAAFVARSITHAPYRYTGTAAVAAPAEEVMARLPAPVPGKVVARDDGGCVVRLGADRLDLVVRDVVALLAAEAEVTLEAAGELLDQLDAVAGRLRTVTRRARRASADAGRAS